MEWPVSLLQVFSALLPRALALTSKISEDFNP